MNPRRIESVKSGVGELIQIRPDTDVYFLAALLHELERIGGFDEQVAGCARQERRRVCGRSSPATRPSASRASPASPADVVRHVARDWTAARGASVTMSTGVNMGRQGTLAYWLVHMLSFVTGNLDRRGGNIESVGYYPTAAKAGRPDPARTFFDSRSAACATSAARCPGNLLADEILTPGPGQVRALFVIAGNPLLSMADEPRLRKALASLDLLV